MTYKQFLVALEKTPQEVAARLREFARKGRVEV